jgi:pyruvate dehydrogenase E2 component (dihydrolipoamide acetyltransferase)
MELKLPELGENIKQGTVTKVLVKAGDVIKKGQNILELETDKAVLEVPSNMDGVVSEILTKPGATVAVGQPVFKLSGSAAAEATPKASGSPTKTLGDDKSSVQPPPSAISAAVPEAEFKGTGGVSEMKLPALGENIEKGTIT